MKLHRRTFLKSASFAAGSFILPSGLITAAPVQSSIVLPEGSAPAPVNFPHFPNRLLAFIWRNWNLVPIQKLATVIKTSVEQVRTLGRSIGLSTPARVTADQLRRSYITIIRRNWHLLPYNQLLELLDWTPEHMAYILREDDFLFVKLGNLKPKCSPLLYTAPIVLESKRSSEIAALLRAETESEVHAEPLFSFIKDLAAFPKKKQLHRGSTKNENPRFCYSYFALYGDPLLEPELDPYPDGYLARLAELGVNGVWLQAVLHKLAPFPWINENAAERARRLRNLAALTKRAAQQGIGIYLYLNEPRAMPVEFFEDKPELKGVREGNYCALCTSVPEVQSAIANAIAHVCAAAPDLAGFFSISGSENLTNCWSHGNGAACPRCGKRSPAEVIAEINKVFHEGIEKANTKADLLVWDWGWHDDWAEEIIKRLPASAALMSVSEWGIPIRRGGIDGVVGEYSISTIGPGPRATRHWNWARQRGLRTIAKIQAGNTWELSAVPYIPALQNVALHAARLKEAQVDGLMLGWTLGGYPSPNLEIACKIFSGKLEKEMIAEELIDHALHQLATERFGIALAGPIITAWKTFSAAFSEFPFHGGLVYNAPMQFGPSNLLWSEPTGYHATMIGFPYDDLDGWRQTYPADVFIQQFTKIADGFDSGIETLQTAARSISNLNPQFGAVLKKEISIATAAAIHFRSTANQARFVQLRDGLKGLPAEAPVREQLRAILQSEIKLARRLFQLQQKDSRIGFEASNQYYYTPQDLLEKIMNCQYLLDQWLV